MTNEAHNLSIIMLRDSRCRTFHKGLDLACNVWEVPYWNTRCYNGVSIKIKSLNVPCLCADSLFFLPWLPRDTSTTKRSVPDQSSNINKPLTVCAGVRAHHGHIALPASFAWLSAKGGAGGKCTMHAYASPGREILLLQRRVFHHLTS